LIEERKASYDECYDEACQIELGRDLAAQKTLATEVMKLGSQCKVTLSVFDLGRAASERGATASGGCEEDDVVRSLEVALAKVISEEWGDIPGMTGEPLVASVVRPKQSATLQWLGVGVGSALVLASVYPLVQYGLDRRNAVPASAIYSGDKVSPRNLAIGCVGVGVGVIAIAVSAALMPKAETVRAAVAITPVQDGVATAFLLNW
jgi:hypothetical protein